MGTAGRSAPLRRAGSLLGLLGLELGAVLALHWLGRFPGLRIRWDQPVPWVLSSPVQDVLGAVLRTVGLVMAYWLLASTVLYLLASLTRLPSAVRAVGWATLPLARRVADHAVAVTLATSMVGGTTLGVAGPALAADRGGGMGPPARKPVAAAQATGSSGQQAPRRAGHRDHRAAGHPVRPRSRRPGPDLRQRDDGTTEHRPGDDRAAGQPVCSRTSGSGPPPPPGRRASHDHHQRQPTTTTAAPTTTEPPPPPRPPTTTEAAHDHRAADHHHRGPGRGPGADHHRGPGLDRARRPPRAPPPTTAATPAPRRPARARPRRLRHPRLPSSTRRPRPPPGRRRSRPASRIQAAGERPGRPEPGKEPGGGGRHPLGRAAALRGGERRQPLDDRPGPPGRAPAAAARASRPTARWPSTG